VWTGKIAVFEGPQLTADHVLASACLPTVFRPVEINGEPHWDGGYVGNPALFPLFYSTAADDILLVQINPVERRETPRSVQDIHNRLDEITFNGNLLNELRAIDFVKTLLQKGMLSYENYKDVRMHRIDGTGVLDGYPASTRLKAEWDFFQTLHRTGHATAQKWLKTHYEAIGHKSTLDLRSTYR
jgi:NTE family protein